MIGTLFVAGAFVDGVTLSAFGLEDLLPGFHVSRRCLGERRHFLPFFLGLSRRNNTRGETKYVNENGGNGGGEGAAKGRLLKEDPRGNVVSSRPILVFLYTWLNFSGFYIGIDLL